MAIASTTRIEWILADLAILCAGGATTTVYPTTAAGDVAFILGDSESVVIFAEDAEQATKALTAGLPCLKAIVLFDGSMKSTDGRHDPDVGRARAPAARRDCRASRT